MKLAIILLVTLVGTVAQAMPWDSAPDFGERMCEHTRKGTYKPGDDDSNAEACIEGLKKRTDLAQLNHYQVALQVCNGFNTMPIHKSTCYGRAATLMREPEFRQESVECDTGFFGGANDWEERAECQRKLFAKKAARFDATAARMNGHSGFRTKN